MKVTFKTGSEANYGSTNGELFFASNTKQIMLNGIKYIPKKLSELTNDSGFLTSITKSMVEGVLTGNITSHTHSYIPLTDKGLSNGKVSYYVDFPTNSQLVSLGYNEESTSTVDEYYFKGLCKWAIKNYANNGYILLMGIASPNSSGFCCIQLYSNSGFDASTRLPRYCSGVYNSLNGSFVNFRCNEHIWYWRGSFGGNALTADKVKSTLAINVNGNITSYDGSKLTSININPSTIGAAAALHTHSYIVTEGDNRSVATAPRDYSENFVFKGLKYNSNIGSPTTDTYSYLLGLRGWLDSTGGQSHELAFNDSGVYRRQGATTEWGSWYKILDSGNYNSYALPLTGGTLTGTLNMPGQQINAGSITVSDSINAGSISANSISCGGKDVSLVGHTHSFASLTSKPTTLEGYGLPDAMRFVQSDASNYVGARFNDTTLATKAANAYIEFWQGAGWFNLKAGKFITNGGTSSQFLKGDGSLDSNTYALSSTLNNYLPLAGGTLNGALTVPTLTATGGILLGDSSLSAMVGSIGIQRHDETGFIGFLKDFNLGNSFNGVVLGWDGNYSLQENSVRIDASTFTYKGNNVWHSGNLKLGYISSGLSRAVQKDTNGNLYIVAPSLFEQGISNNYPKNLRWSNETEGQLVYEKEIEAGNFDTVEIGIPLADGTSKGFLKSTSTVTNVIGYTPCPVVSGTPYYKEDCLYLGSTEIGYTGIMEYGIQHTFNYGTKLPYLEDYTPDSIPRCVVLCFPDRSSNYRFLFWLSAFDEGDPYIARFYNSAYETWLTIDTASRQIILSYGNTWQS